MVIEMDSFREKFKDYSDYYTVIGGAACDILMTEADLPFRATKDIDMILIIEDRYQEFAAAFWEYIKEGHYRCGWKNNSDMHFYRFTEPNAGYPIQIELFSRMPEYKLDIVEGIIPIHIDDDVSSLSAILLNDDYYQFMLEGRKIVQGIGILDAEHIIPFKMFAWLDLKRRKASGGHVNEKDLKKHKNDVFRLLQIVPNGAKILSSGLVKENILHFLTDIKNEDLRLGQMGLPFEKDEAIALLEEIYG